MAIPPANPPPRYEPPARSDSFEPSNERPSFDTVTGRPPSGLDPRARGCVIALGMAAAIGCIASLGIAVSCRGCMQMGEAQTVRQIAAAYRTAANGTDEQEADEATLHELEQLTDDGSLSILAFGVLNNRYNDALVNDGRIDAGELHHGMELVRDIVSGRGAIVIEHYPSGR
jgi:hypothetical protein